MPKSLSARRDEFLETADLLFRTRGYEATSVKDIVEAVGSYPVVFYRCFPDKAACYEELIDRRIAVAWQQILPQIQGQAPDEMVLQMIRTFFSTIRGDELTCAYFSQPTGGADRQRCTAPFVKTVKHILFLCHAVFSQCQGTKLDGFPNAHALVGVVISTIIGWCTWQAELGSFFSADEVEDALVGMVRATVDAYVRQNSLSDPEKVAA